MTRITMRTIAIAAAAAVLACFPGGAHAQVPVRVALDPGTQVRLTTRGAPDVRIKGRVEALRNDTLHLLEGGDFRSSHPTATIETLEIRGGEDKRRGVLIGAAIGAGIVVVFGGIDHSRGEIGTAELLSTTVGNALIGGLIGYAFAPRGWERIPVPR